MIINNFIIKKLNWLFLMQGQSSRLPEIHAKYMVGATLAVARNGYNIRKEGRGKPYPYNL